MREIKFRGRKLNNDDWVYGWLWKSPDGRTWIKSFKTREDCLVNPKTIGQFTGLWDKIDKCSVEIYEGDIVGQPYFSTKEKRNKPQKIREVKWFEGKNKVGWSIAKDSNFEVIGNIYENKYLI